MLDTYKVLHIGVSLNYQATPKGLKSSLDVDENSVEGGAPREGEIIDDQKGGTLRDPIVDEDCVLGDISFLLMVFKDEAAKNRMVNVINSGI